ncbi:peptidylprolyl isomerase [Lonepinella sp. BR2919]|uniref:peptidylprolyl isomerase n=1 Tax=unclassified Lonepinella TaxID=2642006 RepID=UPI003F6E1E52
MITLHTNFGDIKIALNFEKAPITAKNFEDYCKSGFYNNTIFHRVIDGFMIQGGGMESGLREKATNAPIKNEANNRLSNKRGTLAMARTSDPHSASSQFFINVADNTFLDYCSKEMFGKEVVQEWGYAVFGEVIEGMDVVDKIKGVKTGNAGFHQDVPKEDVVITSVTVSA